MKVIIKNIINACVSSLVTVQVKSFVTESFLKTLDATMLEVTEVGDFSVHFDTV